MDISILNKIFKSDKSTWYETGKDGVRRWNKELVDNFWNLLRKHKINKNDYNFDGYNFPTFYKSELGFLNTSESYYVEIFGGIDKIVKSNVTFKHCKFIEHCVFQGSTPPGISQEVDIIYLKDINFVDCIFENEFRLQGLKLSASLHIHNCSFLQEHLLLFNNIKGNVNISNCTIDGGFGISANVITGTTNIGELKVFKKTTIHHSKFLGRFSINTATFNDNFNAHTNSYAKHSVLAYVNFERGGKISNETLNDFSFQNIKFSDHEFFLEELKIIENTSLKFSQCFFPKTLYFIRCECEHINFTNSQILDANFISCRWNIKNGRLIIKDETSIKKDYEHSYINLEELYRQFKRNFDSTKNWELSGTAYVSEMEMRKKRLYKDKNYFMLFIYWFYGFFGGYTQNIKRPILSLGLLFLFFSCLYILVDFNIINALERSAKASLPYIQINQDVPFKDYWLLARNLQLILSGIFLSFFILALRKRFKQ